MSVDYFEILQLKRTPDLHYHRFADLKELAKEGLTVDRANYESVYKALLPSDVGLEDIYYTFNMNRPEDFHGHSLSVSDIVILCQNGTEKAYYCDSIGFEYLPKFCSANYEKKQGSAKTDLRTIRETAARYRTVKEIGKQPAMMAERSR